MAFEPVPSKLIIQDQVEPTEEEKKRKGKLLVLDLNGILADIVGFVPTGYKADRTFRQKSVFKRPFCDDFLKFCFDNFDVGVWSSRTKRNVDDLVNYLMGDMRHQLRFCWDSSHCTNTGFHTLENRHKPLVLKELKKLWEKQEPGLPWENGEYNESNTILLDDSPYKALNNPAYTGIFPYSFRLYDHNDDALGPGGDIRVYLEGLSMADNVQNYIQQHPFGQGHISTCQGSYGRVLGAELDRLSGSRPDPGPSPSRWPPRATGLRGAAKWVQQAYIYGLRFSSPVLN